MRDERGEQDRVGRQEGVSSVCMCYVCVGGRDVVSFEVGQKSSDGRVQVGRKG